MQAEERVLPSSSGPPHAVGAALRWLEAGLRAALWGGLLLVLLRGTGCAGPLGWTLLAGIALARGLLLLGVAGRWLRRVREIERRRLRALAATGLARSRAARDPSALTEAGDRFESAGRARAELVQLGAEPSRLLNGVRILAEWLGRALAPAPGLRGWLERRLVR